MEQEVVDVAVLIAPPRQHGARRAFGILLMVLGGVGTLFLALVAFAIWALGAGSEIAVLLSDWRFFGPFALAASVVAFGAALATSHVEQDADANQGRMWKVALVSVLLLSGIVAIEYVGSLPPDEGPYPFGDAPKGSLIAYTAPDGIHLVRSDGGRAWRVPHTGALMGPVWTPDGERLAANGGFDGEGFSAVAFDVVDGSSRSSLPSGSMTTPVWSPDGSRLVVVGLDEPVMRVLRSSDAHELARLPLPGNDPAWSPDGRWIAFQSNRRGELLDIYVVRPDGTGLRNVTHSPPNPNREGAAGAASSPDGRTIAFSDDRGEDADLYVVRFDGTGLRRLTRSPAYEANPTWSPDGHRVAFDRVDYERERSAIVVRDLRTGAETELDSSDLDFVMEPAWQPAGS